MTPTLQYKAQDGTWKAVGGSSDADAWIRPTDWLAVPTPAAQRFVGLLAVFDNDSNLVALRASVTGGYTVDWGDGQITNHATATTAEHAYDYASIPASTLSSRGYKQVVVTVYPQAANNITSFSLQFRHSRVPSNAYIPAWLDIAVNLPNCTSLALGGTTVSLRMLEQATILAHGATTLANLFSGCTNLRSVPLFSTSNVTSMSNTFYNCAALRTVPLFDLSKCTNTGSMFQACALLRTIPAFDTSKVTTMSSMFSGCTSLVTIPLINMALVTNIATMFYQCDSLVSLPALNLTSVTVDANAANLFACPNLASAPLQNVKVTISFASCKLSGPELNKIYNGLASGVTGKTITVTGNPGVADDDPTIATAKGWTVTGS